mgnify:CR=1 FL=1
MLFRSNLYFSITGSGGPSPITQSALVIINDTSQSIPDVYDGYYLTIPTLDVGPTSYKNVIVTVGNVIRVGGGYPTSANDSYNPYAGQLTIPTATFNGTTFNNVVVTLGSVISVFGVAQNMTVSPVVANAVVVGVIF